jgi:hypothetical protein
VTHGVKAFERIVIGPCTLVRTWGTRIPRLGYHCAQFLQLSAKSGTGVKIRGIRISRKTS